eukprot:m.1405835 g.1405835  ORF g.1405835 m.1405835 type:complete len:158 (+) comp25012_c0_seq105:2355-2828(+)
MHLVLECLCPATLDLWTITCHLPPRGITLRCVQGRTHDCSTHRDERTSAAVAQWLLAAAAHSDATLIAIRPAVTALAKICQQNRCLPVLLGVVARVCVKLSNSGQTTALNFFVSLVTKSSVLLSAFVGELPTDPTNAEDVVDVVSTPSLPIQEHYVM